MLDFFNYPIITCGILSLIFSGFSIWKVSREYSKLCSEVKRLTDEYDKLNSLNEEVRNQIRSKIEEVGNKIKIKIEKHCEENLSRGGRYKEFKTPSRTFEAETLRILQVLPDGNCLAALINYDYNEDREDGQLAYLLLKETEKYKFYDDEELELNKDTVIFWKGIFQYRAVNGSMQKTIPAVQILGLEECE